MMRQEFIHALQISFSGVHRFFEFSDFAAILLDLAVLLGGIAFCAFDFDIFVNEAYVPEVLPEEEIMAEEPAANTGWILPAVVFLIYRIISMFSGNNALIGLIIIFICCAAYFFLTIY